MPTLDDIAKAAELIAPYIRRTPTIEIGAGELGIGCDAVLKLELLQHTGSFKPRGALHRALTNDIGPAGLVAASGGNHGAAVAWVGSTLAMQAEVFVPGVSPQMKRDHIASLGATVKVVGDLYDDAQQACDERAAETGAFQIHPFNHFATVAAAGTVASEFVEAHPDLDTILVAAGGGGLSAGVAARCRNDIKVVIVEPEGSRCVGAALDAGEPVDVSVESIAADSLGAKRVGTAPFAAISKYADQAITVPDEAIKAAQHQLWASLRLIVEPGGAAALAALTSGAYKPSQGERVGVIVCGANTDPANIVS
ncbi:MAG: pyridoxal-phosphate dependent enzyme [Actinobacteria bacterium]|nr:pyridoxal-phosphate dependent enzyme [Actinomycetota bacterium]